MSPAGSLSGHDGGLTSVSALVHDQLSERLLAFGALLRQSGLGHDASQTLDLHALASSDYLQNRQSFRYALKTCYCQSQEHWHNFDELFDSFWHNSGEIDITHGEPDSNGAPVLSTKVENDGRLVGFAGTSSQTTEQDLTGAGDYKALSLADFRFIFDPLEMHTIERLVDDLARRSRKLKSRRKRNARSGPQIDMQRSLSRVPRYDGVVAELHYLRRRRRLPGFVLLLDVSQSMEVYSRLFLRFSIQLASAFRQSDLFAFNTQLISLGSGRHGLSEQQLEARINAESSAWLGGTRIAHSLTDFQDNHAYRVLDKNTTVVVFSDGCDTVPPEELAPVVNTLQSNCRKLIWVNPLLGRFKQGETDRYMDPLLPYIDRYFSAHNLQSLKKFGHQLLS